MILALTSFFQSHLKYINLLTKVLKSTKYFFRYIKAFGKVWMVLHSKFRKMVSLVNQSCFEKIFFKPRKQQVALNDQHSSWRDVNASVPRGLILGPLLSLVYINDLSNGLKSNLKLFKKVNNVLHPPLSFNYMSIQKQFLQKSKEVLLYFANFNLCYLGRFF